MLAITAAFKQVPGDLNGNQKPGAGFGFQDDASVERSSNCNAISQAEPELPALTILTLGMIGFGSRKFMKE